MESLGKGKTINLSKIIYKVFVKRIWFTIIVGVIAEILTLVNLFTLQFFIVWILDDDKDWWPGFCYAAFLGGLATFVQLLKHHQLQATIELGMMIKNALMGALFDKLERLAPKSYAKISAGKLVTIATGEIMFMEKVFVTLSFLVTSPVMGIFCFIFIGFLTDAIVAGISCVIYILFIITNYLLAIKEK